MSVSKVSCTGKPCKTVDEAVALVLSAYPHVNMQSMLAKHMTQKALRGDLDVQIQARKEAAVAKAAAAIAKKRQKKQKKREKKLRKKLKKERKRRHSSDEERERSKRERKRARREKKRAEEDRKKLAAYEKAELHQEHMRLTEQILRSGARMFGPIPCTPPCILSQLICYGTDSKSSKPLPKRIPLRYLTRHKTFAWETKDPETGATRYAKRGSGGNRGDWAASESSSV